MRVESHPNLLLRGVLVLLGVAIIFLGLNVALGGIKTLGWQGGRAAFVAVTDPAMFAVRDSHIRFIGGVWLALGLLMLAGSLAFQRLRSPLIGLMAMIFIGGLMRFSGDLSILMSADVAPSLVFEILAAPLLALWFSRAERHAAPMGD